MTIDFLTLPKSRLRVVACFLACIVLAACGGDDADVVENSSPTQGSSGGGSGGGNSAANEITISWDQPTQKVNGDPLASVAGFRIHYGTTPGSPDISIDIFDPDATEYLLEGMESGTYYFSVSTVDSDLNEGPRSAEESKSL